MYTLSLINGPAIWLRMNTEFNITETTKVEDDEGEINSGTISLLSEKVNICELSSVFTSFAFKQIEILRSPY